MKALDLGVHDHLRIFLSLVRYVILIGWPIENTHAYRTNLDYFYDNCVDVEEEE